MKEKFQIKEDREANIKEADAKEMTSYKKVLKIIIQKAVDTEKLARKDRPFDDKEYSLLNELRYNLRKRDKLGPLRELPRALPIFGATYPLTWRLPKGVVEWAYDLKRNRIKAVHTAIKETLEECFSEKGKYCLSVYHFPHWGTKTDQYPSLHFHGYLAIFRFTNRDKKDHRGVHKIKQWLNANEEDKVKSVPEFFRAPDIEFNDELSRKVNDIYKEKLVPIFYEKNCRNNVKLFWNDEGCMIEDDSRERFGNYVRNPILFVSKEKRISYDQVKETVMLRNRVGYDPDNNEYFYGDGHIFEVNEYIHRYILNPIKGFYGLYFGVSGAYHWKSGFHKILQFTKEHPEIIIKESWKELPEASLPELLFETIKAED